MNSHTSFFLNTSFSTIRRETIEFAGHENRKRQKQVKFAEKTIADQVSKITRNTNDTEIDNVSEMIKTKTKFEEMGQEIMQGIIVRSRGYYLNMMKNVLSIFLMNRIEIHRVKNA